jgi:hypothetical protein
VIFLRVGFCIYDLKAIDTCMHFFNLRQRSKFSVFDGENKMLIYNAFYTNSNVLFFLVERWAFLESGIPLVFFFNFIKLILPGPGFKPVTSRIAGRRCPSILSHLTQVKS